MIGSIYNAGMSVWDTITAFAFQFLTYNPFTVESIGNASGSMSVGALRGIVQGAYQALLDIVVPLAIVLFLLALFKIVISTPPNQQIYAFLGSGIKFGIVIAIGANMWSILTVISRICASVVVAVADSAGGSSTITQLVMPEDIHHILTDGWGNAVYAAKLLDGFNAAGLDTVEEIQDANFFQLMGIVSSAGINSWAEKALANMIAFFFAILFFIVATACSVIILLTAFKRFIKPLIITPFSLIAIATGAGGPEASRSLSSFIRTFIGFMLSGAIMVLGFAVGSLAGNLLQFPTVTAADPIHYAILGSLRMMAIPLLTTGIIKGADSMMSKALGL